ncbi:MAG: cation transporter [Desulfurococcales archaeon]|nr:cation transporter [Desulfurococcales archaeon]
MKKADDNKKIFYTIVFLGFLAGFLKIIGGVVYMSRAVLVDAATSIANILSLIIIMYFISMSRRPPDADHMYGHLRYAFGGDLFMLLFYSFIAGILLPDLANSVLKGYKVDVYASVYSFSGFMTYVVVVFLTRRIGRVFEIYRKMTYIELVEGAVATISAFTGSLYSFYLDLAGGLSLYSILVFEILSSARILLLDISDVISEEIIKIVSEEITRKGLRISDMRLRQVYQGVYYGEIIIMFPEDMSLREAHKIIDEIERTLSKRNIYVTIHPEPSK